VFDSKTVRRRRAALGVFVALSVALLTVYFGESGGGVLHAFQRGAQTALSPLETGASRALKPFQDFAGWIGDTFDAKGENKRLRSEVQQLRSQVVQAQTAERDVRELRGLIGVRRRSGFPQGTDPIGARVIAHSPTVWYSTIEINQGSRDGVRREQAVIASGGLIGKVTSVTGGTAEVTLITDASSAVSAQVVPSGANGIVRPQVGNPNDLLLDFVQKGTKIRKGQTVITSGFTSSRLESLFPRGIPIGRVTKADIGEVELYERVHIAPFANLRRINYVQVLTRRPATTQAGVLAP
jgi:rod shape-determining protein MreC